VVAWGNLAEICKQHLRKGQQVYVEGRLQTRSWEDQDGRKRFRTELVANEMIVLGKRDAAEIIESIDEGTDEFPF
jgi:single-strand DNA-binding protein